MRVLIMFIFFSFICFSLASIPQISPTVLNDKEFAKNVIENLNKDMENKSKNKDKDDNGNNDMGKSSLDCGIIKKPRILSPNEIRIFSFHHVLPLRLLKIYLKNYISILLQRANDEERNKFADAVNNYLQQKCVKFSKEPATTEEKESTKSALKIFYRLFLYNKNNLFIGPEPQYRENDPGSKLDIELIKNCPDNIKTTFKSLIEFLNERELENSLVTNFLSKSQNFKIQRNDQSEIGKKYLAKVTTIFQEKGDPKKEIGKLMPFFTNELTQTYSTDALFNFLNKVEDLDIKKCETRWSRNKKKLTDIIDKKYRWNKFKKSNTIGGVDINRETQIANGYMVKEKDNSKTPREISAYYPYSIFESK